MKTPYAFQVQEICSQPPTLPRAARQIRTRVRAYDYYNDDFNRCIMMVPIKDIVPSEYQRDKKDHLVQFIADNWIPQMLRNPVGYWDSSLRKVAVVDCQHSTDAAQNLFPEDSLIPVTMTNKQCAYQLFILLNFWVSKVANNEMFYASLKGNNDIAVYVDQFLSERGITHKKSGRSVQNCTGVPGAFLDFFAFYGETQWNDTVDRLVRVHNGEPRSLSRTYLDGFFRFNTSQRGLRTPWRKISDAGSEAIYNHGKQMSKSSGGIACGIARALRVVH